VAIVLLAYIGGWAKSHARELRKAKGKAREGGVELPRKRVVTSVLVLMALLFSKYFYLASLTSYYTFYLISKFQVSVRASQLYLFVFLGAVAIGTVVGGPIGDRIGRKYVIWCSILGVLPFTMLLPYVDLFWTGILSVVIGLVLASAFSAIVVYAQELVPGRVGMISGLCYGFAFGVAGLGAALLGELADATSIGHVYRVCSYLPAVGLLAAFLPNIEGARRKAVKQPQEATVATA
jgi:FSR family fosmidomycin resistance protein-like MFS transporter